MAGSNSKPIGKIQEKALFFSNFIKNPLTNASVIPSSKRASKKILENIDFSKINSVLELGPGNGIFTGEIIKRCKPDTKIVLIEIEDSYIKILKRKFGKRIIIENTWAHNMADVLDKHNINPVDLIISGLPFSGDENKKDLNNAILEQADQGAIYRFFTYMPGFMKKAYKDMPIEKYNFVFRNIPPMWIYGIN